MARGGRIGNRWAMIPDVSEVDVEVLEGVYAEWAKGNLWTPEVFDPEVEITWMRDSVDTYGTTKGIDPMRTNVMLWFEGLDDVRFEPERFVDLGDRVLVVAVMKARGRGSGVEVTGRYGHLWTLRDGKAIRLEDADPDGPLAQG
jgi:ketosteroid isomerase-like protein